MLVLSSQGLYQFRNSHTSQYRKPPAWTPLAACALNPPTASPQPLFPSCLPNAATHHIMAEETPARPLKIAIIGAGIAGLATAIALRIHGTQPHDAVVFEKYGEAEPTFSGPVQLQPNATKILTRYGVADAVSKSLPELHSVHNIHRYTDGKLLSSTSAKLVNSTYKFPYGLSILCFVSTIQTIGSPLVQNTMHD